MEQIGKLIKSNSANLQRSSQGSTTIVPSANAQEPLWWDTLEKMALDKRQDWWPGILLYWTEKLKSYREDEIQDALSLYSGEFFPSVDAIVSLIERKRQVVAEQRTQAEWPAWKASQAQAECEGQLATQEQYDELREVFRKVAFGPPLIPMKSLGVKSGKSGEAVQVQRSSEQGAQNMAPQVGDQRAENQSQRTGQADV